MVPAQHPVQRGPAGQPGPARPHCIIDLLLIMMETVANERGAMRGSGCRARQDRVGRGLGRKIRTRLENKS